MYQIFDEMHQYFEPFKMTRMDSFLVQILITKNDDYLIVKIKTKRTVFWAFKLPHNTSSNECDVVLFFKIDNWVWVVYVKPYLTSSNI
jgi:hypothetical protein